MTNTTNSNSNSDSHDAIRQFDCVSADGPSVWRTVYDPENPDAWIRAELRILPNNDTRIRGYYKMLEHRTKSNDDQIYR